MRDINLDHIISKPDTNGQIERLRYCFINYKSTQTAIDLCSPEELAYYLELGFDIVDDAIIHDYRAKSEDRHQARIRKTIKQRLARHSRHPSWDK